MNFLWVLTAISAGAGALVLLIGLAAAKGAPQEAAAAAIALSLAVIPYVFTRAVAACFAMRRRDVRDAIVEALRLSREETLERLRPPPAQKL